MNIYSIRDNQTGHFNVPFFQVNDAAAIRLVGMMHDEQQSFVSKFPQHFDLYNVGEFDQQSGEILPCKPQFMINAKAASAVDAIEKYNGKKQRREEPTDEDRTNHAE